MRIHTASCTIALVLAAACTDATAPHLQSSLASVSAGDFFSCGLTSGGVAYCWGDDRVYPATSTPYQAGGNLRFQALAAGLEQTCGIVLSGGVYCWGFFYGATPVHIKATAY